MGGRTLRSHHGLEGFSDGQTLAQEAQPAETIGQHEVDRTQPEHRITLEV